jgi:hypothetical protein
MALSCVLAGFALGNLLIIGLMPVVLVLSLPVLSTPLLVNEAGVSGIELYPASKACCTTDVNPRDGCVRTLELF